ncbi:FAD-binding oxidoreductase [Streptomyces sp. NPDC059009]|uniref:FAD-binding oxidoreductase n=1 Tax=Streptomyces sp. NPDC059009 TaxID=3346694 RepID=UPI0036CE3504
MTRRKVLATAAAGAAAVGATSAAAAGPTPRAPGPVGPEDPRYRSLTTRGANARFVGKPDYVRLVETTEQVVDAVRHAVGEGKRIAVRSGGHCFEDFVDAPEVRVVIDMSPMRRVSFDEERRAFEVEPGALLGEVYRQLFLGWGVTIPAGATAEVGVGGHVLGGGYGTLSRRHGLCVDHLEAVEVVVVDRAGGARAVVATRDPGDPHHDLWWAHTGGGGGNFGVVTRYWFRDPRADRDAAPARLLPSPPAAMLTFSATWGWHDLDARDFARLLRNHGEWYERNSAPDSPYAGMLSALMANHRSLGFLPLSGLLDATLPGAHRLVDAYVDAVGRGVGARPVRTVEERPWLQSVAAVQEGGSAPFKIKSGYLRRRFTDRQIAAVHDHLAGGRAGEGISGSLWLVSYGGRVNTVAPDATAVAQRDSVLKAIYMTDWKPEQDAGSRLEWVRSLYRSVYADSGGVPAPGAGSDGAFINYPDTDLADPAQNTSGVPWHELYYKGNYARLQRVKAAYDPRDTFRHKLGVRP